MQWHRFPQEAPEEGRILLICYSGGCCYKTARYAGGAFFDTMMIEIYGARTGCFWSEVRFPSEAGGWTRCQDSPPSHDDCVLVCSEIGMDAEAAEYDEESGEYFDAIGDGLRFVPTHWMPVEPPGRGRIGE